MPSVYSRVNEDEFGPLILDDLTELNEDPVTVTDGVDSSNSPAYNPHVIRKICHRLLQFTNKSNQFKVATCIQVILSVFMLVTVPLICVLLGWYSLFKIQPMPVIDKSYQSFNIPNHKASIHFDAFTLAEKYNSSSSFRQVRRQKRSVKLDNFEHESHNIDPVLSGLSESRLESRKKREFHNYRVSERPPQYRQRWKMQVIYVAEGEPNANIFTKERIQAIHHVEEQIRNHPHFHQFCWKDYRLFFRDDAIRYNYGCAPFNSMLTYFYPSRDSKGKLHYDGLGNKMAEIDSALQLAMGDESFYLYVDQTMNKTYRHSSYLRTEIIFGAPLPGYFSVGHLMKEQNEKYKEFVVTYVNVLSAASTSKVRVLYGGATLFDYEVNKTFWEDVHLALYALIAIIVFLFILSSFSMWLTFWGIASIVMSFSLAMFFYRVIYGISSLGILNGAAAFVVIGIANEISCVLTNMIHLLIWIPGWKHHNRVPQVDNSGVDDVFVFINIYRQSNGLSLGNRLKHTIMTAGKATFFTSFTTAAAFAANISSSIPAIHDFGLFMSLIVSCCWLLVFLLMPPALLLWELCFAKFEGIVFRILVFPLKLCRKLFQSFKRKYQNRSAGLSIQADMIQEEEADVAMLQIDEEEDYGLVLEDDDVPLIVTQEGEHRETSAVSTKSPVGYLGAYLQMGMDKFIATPVIKFRWLILGLFIIILGVSIGFMTRLRPATKPPQIFKPDTNLQRLLDLKANLSLESLPSSIFDSMFSLLKKHHTHRNPHPHQPTSNNHNDSIVHEVHELDMNGTENHLPLDFWNRLPNMSLAELKDILLEIKAHHIQIPPEILLEGLNYLKQHNLSLDQFDLDPDVLSDDSHSNEDSGDHRFQIDEPNLLSTVKPLHADRKWTKSKNMASLQKILHKLQDRKIDDEKGEITTIDHAPGNKPPASIPKNPKHKKKFLKSSDKKETSTISSFPIPPLLRPLQKKIMEASTANQSYNVCDSSMCKSATNRPLLETGAVVHVVFGIKGLDKSHVVVGHVVNEFKGTVEFDRKFPEHFKISDLNRRNRALNDLCRICKVISSNRELVKNGSAQCVPVELVQLFNLDSINECKDLPQLRGAVSEKLAGHAVGGVKDDSLLWWSFAFESTTSKGQSYFNAYKQYLKWEEFISHIKVNIIEDDSPLQTMYQTSEFWKKVLMEVVAVSSAIYGLVFSMVICIIAVAIFTSHPVLLILVVITISGMICLVVGMFYFAGWEMGAVEAVSLSILVGSSVDYCVHLVEGYLLAGSHLPPCSEAEASVLRKWRTKHAIHHIGVSILSSAVTTIVAAIPLTQATIQPFAKFGDIVAINTAVCIVYTLTVCAALLSTFGPARFKTTWKSFFKASLLTGGLVGLGCLVTFILIKSGVTIPGPNGDSLF